MASEVVEEAQVPLGKNFCIFSKTHDELNCLGLLDQPVLMEGKRKRKATKQYNVEAVTPKKKVATKHVGSGTRLQDIPSGTECYDIIYD